MTWLNGTRALLAPIAAAVLLGGCAETQLIAHTAKQARQAVTPDTPAGRAASAEAKAGWEGTRRPSSAASW